MRDFDPRVLTFHEELDTPGPSKGRIAVDMDDVLCQTNATIVKMHNELFGLSPPMQLSDFENCMSPPPLSGICLCVRPRADPTRPLLDLYWQNRGWGTPQETVAMVSKLYAGGLYMNSPPVPGAKEGLLRLKALGYSLIIITARSEKQREGSEQWIERYLPDIFDEIHFTGAFAHLEPTEEEKHGHVANKAVVSHKKRSKAEIVHSTSSLFLIDDSSENAYDASHATPPARVLLFGTYPWNAVVHRPETAIELDTMPYSEKVERGLLEKTQERRREQIAEGWLPDGVERVADWEAVVEWVQAKDR